MLGQALTPLPRVRAAVRACWVRDVLKQSHEVEPSVVEPKRRARRVSDQQASKVFPRGIKTLVISYLQQFNSIYTVRLSMCEYFVS